MEGATSDDGAQPAPPDSPLYFALPLGQYIRLLELKPGAPGDPVVGHLTVVELDKAPAYEAISYVWGRSGSNAPTFCNGREVDVTANLRTALARVRYADRSRVLWAD